MNAGNLEAEGVEKSGAKGSAIEMGVEWGGMCPYHAPKIP